MSGRQENECQNDYWSSMDPAGSLKQKKTRVRYVGRGKRIVVSVSKKVETHDGFSVVRNTEES